MFIALFLIPFLFIVFGALMAHRTENQEYWGFTALGAVVLPFALIIDGGYWDAQADDLGTIQAQDQVSAVYQQQVASLTAELQAFHYSPGALLNADSPVAAVVKALSDAQAELTEAQARKARAIVSIEQRRHGPMSGVIWWAGDYKQ